ncbi:PEPxxWA-CTERM sorting domain-containing protein [Frankia sp. RB7]|nr:PEPxxWA-CTERM sorting domain-containing protein [Frankia sp. RB7]
MSGYVNANVAINPSTFPTGSSTGNQGTTLPFNIATLGNAAGSWIAPSGSSTLTVNLGGLNLTGQQSFYALLNNYYGTPNFDEYDITVNATNGVSVTFQSIGGVDTRDYNQNAFTNSIANTTGYWYDNHIGQRLDVRTFVLPSDFAAQTLTSFVITQNAFGMGDGDFDNAVFSGLTFSDESVVTLPGAVPEPSTWAMMVLGFAGVGFMAYRRRDKVSALTAA